MQKYLVTAAFVISLYILPLLGRQDLLSNWKLFVMMTGCAILLLSQPTLSVQEAEEKKETDRGSVYFIMIASAVSQIVTVIDWGYFQSHTGGPAEPFFTALGFIMIAAGIVFRLWSIRTLGRFFTATVQVNADQEIVQSGPYAIVRHPSYLGAYVAILGSAIFVQSWLGFVVGGLAMGYAYQRRVTAEEGVLTKAFGDVYSEYQKRTARLIPCLW